MLRVLFIVITASSAIISFGQTRVVNFNNPDNLSLVGTHIEYLADPMDILSIEDVVQPEQQSKFVLNDNDIFSKPPQSTSFWFKITVRNSTNEDLLLEVGGTPAAEVDYYVLDEQGNYTLAFLTGSNRPDENKFINVNLIWLPLNKAGDKDTKTYYLRMSSKTVVQFPFYIGTSSKLYEKKKQNDFIIAGFLGFTLSIFLYNLFLYFSVKERSYLYYLGYLLSIFLFFPFVYNYEFLENIFTFINPDWWHSYFNFLASPIYLFVGLFCVEYLKLRDKLPFMAKMILIVSYFFGIGMPLINFFMASHQVMIFAQLLASFLILSCLISSIFLLYKDKDARSMYYSVGWTIFVILHTIFMASGSGYISYNLFTSNSMIFGTALEIITFSLALAHQVNEMRIEKEQIQQENFQLVKNQNIILEEKVQERTMIISEQKEKLENLAQNLEEINQTKDKLFAIIGHDLRSPIGAIEKLMKLLANEDITEKEFKSLTGNLNKSVESLNFMLNNLLHWANHQIKGIHPIPQKFNVSTIIDENFNLFGGVAKEKNICLIKQVAEEFWAISDKDQINLVIRNLISNAIKFSKSKSKITVACLPLNEDFLQIEIVDNGVGMDEETQLNLVDARVHYTSYGTEGEKGTGLGLILCKEFVEGNGGIIGVQSELGKGSKFYFTIKRSPSI